MNRGLAPREVLVSMGLLLAAALWGYGFLWQGGRTPYSPHSDFLSEHVGTKRLLFDSMRTGGGLPFWRSDKLSGYDALISPVSQFTYPLDALFLFRPPLAAVGPTYWLHFLAAGLVYWLAAAALGLGFWPRLFVGISGMFSFKLILAVYAGWLPNIPGIVFFPALLAAVFHLTRKPGLGAALALALTGALCLHGGIYQLPYYAALFGAAYVLAATLPGVRSGRWRETLQTWGWMASSAALALALSAYLILPLAAEAPLLSRGRSSYDFFLSGHSLSPAQLETFVFPEALGTPLNGTYPGEELWEDECSFGAAALALAVLGVFLGRRRSSTRFLAGGFACAVALSFDTPVLRALFDHLPGFSLFRIPTRFLFLASFFGIALAGVGLEELLERIRSRPRLRGMSAALAAVLVASSAAEGAYRARRYLRMAPSAAVAPENSYDTIFAADKDAYRVATVGRAAIDYGWAARKGLQLINGNDSFNYRTYREYFQLLRGENNPSSSASPWFDLPSPAPGPASARPPFREDMLDALNVKYLVSLGPLKLGGKSWRLAARLKDQPTFLLYRGMRRVDLWIYRNASFLPRAFWAEKVVPAASDADVSRSLSREDLRRSAVVLGGDSAVAAGTASPGDSVRVERSAPGRLVLEATARAARYLVVSESWHPGWRARVDGRPAPLERTDGALLGLFVPEGAHRVELDFMPPLWNLSLAVSGLGALVFLGLTAAWGAGKRGLPKVGRDGARPNW